MSAKSILRSAGVSLNSVEEFMNQDRPAEANQGESATRNSRVVRPTRRVAALLGFLLKAEVDAILQQQPFETESGVGHLELWRQLVEKRGGLPRWDPGAIEQLPASLQPMVDEAKKRKTYREHYEAIADYSFVLAPIESLLSPQWYADVDYIDDLSTGLRNDMSLKEQLRFALSEGRITEPVIQGSQVVFTSPRRDLFANPIPTVRETEEEEFEIVIRAASRPNYIQVAQIGNRLLLTNGVHKVCALYKAGFKKCPCVFRTAHSVEEVGLDPRSSSLLSAQMFNGQRAALVRDFLDPDAAAPLRMRAMYQILQISVGVGMISVPALPRTAREKGDSGGT